MWKPLAFDVRIAGVAAAGILAMVPSTLAAALGTPASAIDTAAIRVASADPVRITVTSRDVDESNAEAASAYGALVTWWTRELSRLGAPFRAPRIARYRGNTLTQCGVMPASNAAYCFDNNTIYFDEVFLAAQARLAGRALGTDGDMAGVGIIAHEMGHAVAFQLGLISRDSYRNEAMADCLAGAFARQAAADGSLEDGDVEEAFFAMAAAADPDVRPTGNRRVDARRASRLQRAAHGTREQRQRNFSMGLQRGPGGCSRKLR